MGCWSGWFTERNPVILDPTLAQSSMLALVALCRCVFITCLESFGHNLQQVKTMKYRPKTPQKTTITSNQSRTHSCIALIALARARHPFQHLCRLLSPENRKSSQLEKYSPWTLAPRPWALEAALEAAVDWNRTCWKTPVTLLRNIVCSLGVLISQDDLCM